MSAEEAAAAFARVDPASNETSNRDEGLEAPSAPTVEHEDPTPPTGDSVSVPGEATDETSEPAPQPEGATRVPPASEASQLDATEPVRSPGFLERLRRALRGQPSLTSTSGASTSGAGRATADEVGEPVDATVSEDTISEDAAPGDAMVADEALVAEDPPPVGEGVFGDTLADNAGARDPHDDAGWELESPTQTDAVLAVRGLTKTFGDTRAVDDLDLDVHAGSFYGIVGPNGAGKTTTLSMITGLLRPDRGSVTVNGIDVWADPAAAKRTIGVLPDRLRVFDRLTGAQLLYYAGTLRGLKGAVVRSRVDDLAREFGLEDAMGRLVSDYSAGMVKKVSLAAAMIHSPRVLILDEPFESVDPVSAAKIVEILRVYVDNGGTVVLSSHSMDFIQRVCDHVAIIVEGQVLAAGAVEDVRGPVSLEARFLELAGGRKAAEGMEWLHSFSG
jgi:ABC-2 type transport system ATP-binding protein